MHFEYEYPVFVVVKRDSQSGGAEDSYNFRLLETPDGRKSLVVFTDQSGAEDYRDRSCPGYGLFRIPNPGTFAGILIAAKVLATHVAFDPWKLGMGVQTATIDEVLKSLGR